MLTKVLSNSIFYSLSSILLRASSIIFFPIFSSYLSKADYGILSITQSITVVISSFAALELQRALTRFLNDNSGNQQPEYQKKLIGNILIVNLITNVIVVGIFLLLGKFILKDVLNDISFYPYVTFSLISVLSNFLVNLYRIYLKATHKGKASFVLDMSFYGANILLNLFFVVILRMDVIGIIYSSVICGAIFSIFTLFKLKNKVIFSLDKIILKPILRYCLPLIPFTWLGIGIEMSSTFFLNAEQGKEISGTFYIAVTFAGVFASIKESIISAITPWFFQNYKEKKNMIQKLIIHILEGGALFSIGVSIFSFEILSLLSNNEELIEGWKYIPLLNLGHMFVFVGQLVNLPIFYEKTKTQYLTLSNIGGFITTFILAYLLTTNYGINGAVISKTTGYFVMSGIILLISWKITQFTINLFHLLSILIATVIFSYSQFLHIEYSLLLSLKISLELLLTYLYLRILAKNYQTVGNFLPKIFGQLNR